MVASWRTPECFPELSVDKIFSRGFVDPPARHEDCQGGHTIPGVFGGWQCPCPCHKEKP